MRGLEKTNLKYSYTVYKVKNMPFHVVCFSSKDCAGVKIYNNSKDVQDYLNFLREDFTLEYDYNLSYINVDELNDDWVYYSRLDTHQIYVRA